VSFAACFFFEGNGLGQRVDIMVWPGTELVSLYPGLAATRHEEARSFHRHPARYSRVQGSVPLRLSVMACSGQALTQSPQLRHPSAFGVYATCMPCTRNLSL
jgi:hypothetical protein